MYKVKTLNKISEPGLNLLHELGCETGDDLEAPDALLVRSAKLHDMQFDPSVVAISRAGAGVNNIPLERCAEEGIVVFNTPGANAEAVKELARRGTKRFILAHLSQDNNAPELALVTVRAALRAAGLDKEVRVTAARRYEPTFWEEEP